ncbi:TcC31.20 [Trypanosoma grayi]|uniref:TcC31.20 n=1 Tax=Trypanosoma grayi TaxID=71804 RepID=UPI0004F4393A|nr:TcC31.20 [Trypanosoma grayi]KEG12502.1 TcC31.20 [Trypanosoma grayi]
MEWQRRVLSDQLASYEESREELEKVRAELEQERLNHARTRSELNEAQSMCQALNQRLEWAHDTQNVSVTRLSTRSSPSKGMREDHLSEGLSPTSMLVTPTPRRQPPPIPQPVVKEEEGTFRTGVSTFSFVQEQQVPSYQDCSESAANHATVDNVPANSTINISDPSISPSATFDLDVSGVPSLLGEAKQGDPPRKTQEEDNRVCSGGAQRDMEEWTEGDGRPSSSDTRSNTHTTLGVQTTGAVGSSSSTCGKSFLKAICDAAVSVHPSKTHPFEQLAGQEALLCKELLRALLDKEKQLAELTSQQVGQKKEEKGKLAFMPE